jgi:hypothetical protein
MSLFFRSWIVTKKLERKIRAHIGGAIRATKGISSIRAAMRKSFGKT